MENALLFSLMFIPGLVGAIVAAVTAKKTNARWRERRAAKARASV